MPLLQPRNGDSDGGYAVADYGAVDPRLGSMADLEALAAELHRRGMALCIDLVLNHTAREHEWARKALAGDPACREMYLIYPDRTIPDAYEATLPEVFPHTAPGSFTEVPGLGWVWTTFHEYQWDLNYANPAVFRHMLATMLMLANRGVDVLRLDAAPFLWKRPGTDCQNQPEAHLLLRPGRAVERSPSSVLAGDGYWARTPVRWLAARRAGTTLRARPAARARTPAASRAAVIQGSDGSDAATLMRTATARDPSAFIATAVQLPPRSGQVRFCVPGPATRAGR